MTCPNCQAPATVLAHQIRGREVAIVCEKCASDHSTRISRGGGE